MNESAWAVSMREVTHRFGDLVAVDRLSLRIAQGSIYGLLGPNGCGKSTTLRLLSGLLTPTAGAIDVLGLQIPKQAEALRQRVGYMTQRFSLWEELTVQENLRFMGQIYGLNRRLLNTRVSEQLAHYDLAVLSTRRAQTLSGGQRQRLALAAATLHRPDLLFLDEPTAAVDPQSRRAFWEQLFALCDQGVTLVVSTHYMDEAERCHTLAILEQGQLRAEGEPDALIAQLGIQVVEVASPALMTLKPLLAGLTGVRSVAQQGARLRVQLAQGLSQPVCWLQQQLPVLRQAELTIVRPSLEDLFVAVTGARDGR